MMKRKLRYFCTLLLMAVVSVAWADDVTDILNQSWTGVSGTSYAEKTGLQGSASNAVYSVQCAGGNDAIQLRTTNSNSGIVSTTSGGTVTKVTVTWNSNTTSGRKLNVYGSNSAYSAPSDLYGSNAGTLIGTIDCGTSTELTISGNYTYIGLRSLSGAIYLDEVKVTWGTPTYTVTYDGNGGEGTMTDPNSPYEENDEVTLLTNAFTAPEGMLWDSWEVKDANDNVITVTNGKFTMPASNVTATAQWVADPNAPQINWVLTDLADLTANDVFVIVGYNGSNYAMTNNNGTSNPPTATAVTVDGNIITSAVAANMQWNISGNATDGYTFYPNGSTSTWLYCTATNNGVRVGTNANKTFKVDGGYLKNDATSRYVGVYNSADWRCYTSNTTSNIAGQTFAFYKKVTGGVLPPSISADNVNIEYDATGGEIVYTINNPIEGGSVNASTTADWLTIGTNFESPIAFLCDANPGATARTATVTLTYTYDNETVTKDVTVTQAAAPVIYTTIPELFAAATSTATNVTITFNNWVISAVKGNNAYLTDNQGNGLIIYQNGHGLNVNDVLSGTASCNLVTYHGSAELIGLTATTEGLTVTPNGTVTEQSIAIADLTGVNTGALLHYDGLTYDGTNLVDGSNNSIKPYSTLYEYAFEEGKTYNVTGIYLQYDTTKELLPRDANDIEEVIKPTITVDPSEVNVGYEGGNGTLTLTYENFVVTGASDFSVVSCHADGSVFTMFGDGDMSSWLTATVSATGTGYEVAYTVTENTAATARTGYFKVVAGDKGSIGSNVVTVTQAAAPQPYTLTVESLANTGMFVFVENDNEVALDGEGSINVYEGKTVMLSVDPEQGYALQSLMVDGVDVTSEIDNTGMYTFTMPNHAVAVTATAVKMLSQEGNYVKVTSTADITDGEYLIVYEDGSLAFDGGLQTLDASGNTIDVTITPGNIIASTSTVDAATFTIESIEGGYSIKSKSGYFIGRTASSNGLNSNKTTVYTNTITIDDNMNAVITSSEGPVLRFNSASNQNRFRYFGSGQQSIQLYKKIAANTVTITIKANFPATTFSCDKALDFTDVEGITAYIITNDEGAVMEVTKVPAGKGLYIEATNTSDTEQTFDVPVITDEEAAEAEAETTFAATKLIPTASDGSKIYSEQTVAYYAYGKPANKPAAFYKISTDPAKGLTQEAGKALLKIEVANASSAKEMIMVNSNVTAIEDVNRETITNNHYYTVDGKCVKGEPTQKGIYIVKGRKVVVK